MTSATRDRREFYVSIVIGVAAALFTALKIPAIGVMLQAILAGSVTAKAILSSLVIMLVSVVGSSLLKYKETALQTDGGYCTTANKRVQIAEHLRYLPMGYFNENSHGAISSVTTNTMDNLSGVSTRVVMLVTEGLFSTAVMTLAVFLFDWRMELFSCVILAICSFMLTEGLEQAGTQSSLLRVVDTCVNQAEDILNLPAMDISGAELTPERHDIHAEDVQFSYDRKPIINGITLDIPEKTTTALGGPSGGGKTTLCHLLARFWDVDGGRVTLGGRDVREYDMDSLMRNFSFVFQNVYLFHDTVANNIRFGQPDAPMEKVIAAAKKARCHDFILKLPQGYETVIGDAGGSLSGGERQRLSIARAMMKDAPIIILDEATANVDPENEKELMEAISELTREKTVIMIAHRLKTVRHADQIIVVDKGQIAQRGTHEELLRQDGIYRRFITGREQAAGWKL